jgi:hypothetical protein
VGGYVDYNSKLFLVGMSSLDEEIIYEEDEVVWAKIRGYPWWPAFVRV